MKDKAQVVSRSILARCFRVILHNSSPSRWKYLITLAVMKYFVIQVKTTDRNKYEWNYIWLWLINLRDFYFDNILNKDAYLLKHEVKRVNSKCIEEPQIYLWSSTFLISLLFDFAFSKILSHICWKCWILQNVIL